MPEGDSSPVYRRILIKLSGEALAGDEKFGITGSVLEAVSKEISDVVNADVQVGVVIGGGNFFRGMSAAASNMDRVTADYIGMLATVMNALALHQALESRGTPARIQSALDIASIVEPYVRARTLKHMANDRAVIFAGGTGNPLFTTDTAASLRAIEMNAELMIKGTKVDGVFDADPETNPDATRYDMLTYEQVLRDNLRVMDATAVTLCRDHNMPIQVLNMNSPGSLLRAVQGHPEGTIVKRELT